MDQLSSMYVRMASSPQSQLHNPTAVVQVVDQLQGIIDRSTALRKNFLIDDTTPRADVVITETSAMKPSLGWITLRVTEGIRRGVHEWCIKIECQGETADGSGLMLGIVPKSFFKYDSFISQGGGWCLSRAGKFYGHWRRQDSSASNISFETGDRVIFWLDYEAARMTVRVGDKCIVGEMSNLNTEVFPAVSLHYRHQHVRFEYHMVHDRRSIPLNWMERRVLPPAAALLPLRVEQLEQLPLASYVTCPQLVSYVSSTHSRQPEGSSPASPASGGPATGSGEEATPASPQLVAEAATKESPQAVLTYMSLEASTARLCVVHNAFASVRRFMALSISRGQFLSPEVTAEYLRQLTAEPAKEAGSGGGGGGGGAAMLGGWPSGARGAKSSSYHYDAALNCGAMIVIHMFAHATSSSSSGMAVPIVTSLTQYLLSLPLFSLCESSNASVLEHGSLSPDIIQLAMDNLIKMVEPFMENEKEVLSSLHSALLELLLLLSLQRGSVSGALRVCRFLLRHPNGGVSSPVVEWLKQHAQSLRPQKELPDIGKAIRTVSEDSQLLIPTRIDAKVDVQSVGYGSGFLYTHNAEGLAKWGNTASEYVQIHRTKEPANCCVGSFRSSIAVTSSQVVLLTDRMIAEGIAVVGYSITLDVLRVYRLGEVAPTWPREARANPHISSGPGDAIVLVYEGYGDASTSGGATTAAATAERVDLEVHGFTGGNLMQPAWSTSLIPPAQDAHLTHCLALRKPSVIELGPPEEHLHVHGGHVTVELWVMLLHKEDAATLYQHGDKSTSGEIFLETVRLEGAFCLRGGYRHEPRGSCDVSAPLPPIAETNFFHVALVFDGRWRLFFDGEEVASNRQGPYVSLDSPKQRWTVGHNCTCLLAGLRVWGCGRAGREVARDYKRTLVGNEAGLVGQYLFHETSGNVAFNYASTPRRARHAVCVGAFSHVLCDNHPLRLGSPSAAPSLLSAMTPVRSPLHDWMDLARSTCFCTDSQLVLTTHLLGPSSPYALPGGRVLTFFDVKTGSGYSSLLFLTNKSSAKGRLGCDAATGQLRELFEHTSTTADKGKLIATAVLPLQQDEADGASTALMSQLEAADALPSACTASQTPVGGEGAGAAVSPFIRGGKYLREMPARLTYSALAVWLLQLMTMYAENEPTQGSCLYSPLADDVSCRCVSEVKGILMEHFRVVKGSNSRRSLTLKCEHSSTIALATLHILLRLVRRARSFGLHPSALGLHIVVPANSSEGMEILLREFTNMASPRRGTAAKRPSKEVEVADDVAARAGGTLLGLLGAIINESGSALSPQLGRIARMVVMEGVELFIPSARCRATLLREVLNTPPSTTGTSATAATTSASSSTATGERVPSLEVLLEAIVSSFSSVQAAMPFLHDLTDAAAAGGEGAENPKVALDELRETLEVLVGESLAQLRASSAPSSSTTTTAGGALRPPPSQRSARVASLLVAAISHLQLLFLSACQGDSGESRTLQPCEVEMLFSCPSTATYNQCVRRYYQRLFHAAAEGLQIVAKRGEQTGTPTLATRAALIELFRGSFLSGPLHAAVVAIPLIVSIEDASWFLAQLEKLLTLAQRMHLHGSDAEVQRSLQEAAQMGLSLEDSPFDALLHAFLFHSAWVANFMAKCITTSTTRGSMMLEEGSERGGNNSGGSSGGGGGGKGKLPYSNTPTSATTPRSRRPEDGKEDEEETEETPQMMQDGPPVDLALVQRMREIRRFCEDPLLSGGVDSAPPAKGLAARQRPRRDFVAAQLRQHAKTWTEAQKGFDALGARIPAELATLVMKMAATAIFLSNTPRLHRFAPKRLNELMIATMRRMMPLRNHHLNLLSSSDKAAQTALLTELERRCALLLQTDPAIEAQVDVLQLYPLSGFALMDEDPVEGAHNDDLSSAFRASDPTRGGGGVARNTAGLPPKPRARWKWAGERVRRVLILHRADALRNAQLDLNAAIALVQRVMQSEVLTAVELQRACAEAKKVAEIRLEGVRHLIRLVRREPTHTEEVARLVSSDSSRRTRHYEDGLSSCPRDTIVTVRTAIYDALKWTLASQRRRPSSSAALHLSSSRLSSASLGPATRTKSSIVEGSENLAMTAGSAMAVAELAHRKWRAHDFAFLRRLRIVEALWEPFCALLRREGDAVVLREESPVEQRHREEVAAHYQRKMQQHHDWVSSRKGTEADGSPTSGPSASLGDDAVEESLTVATSAELARRASLECIKSLGLQCAATMRQDLSVAHDLGCTTFLEHLLAVFETELKRCLDFMKLQETWSPALVRVQEQIGTITGLVGAVAAAIPEDSRFRPALRTSCSRLARCLYFLACCSAWDLRDAGSGAGSGAEESAPAQTLPCTPAANFRVAALLLRHCAPAGCNNVFEDEEARSMCKEIILDWQPGCAALHFFFAMAVRCLIATGLSDLSKHALLGLRSLLEQKAWAGQLAYVAKEYVHDLSSSGDMSAPERSRAIRGHKLFVWIVALGGHLPAIPSVGMRLCFQQEGMLVPKEGFFVDGPNGSKESVTVVSTERSYAWMLRPEGGNQPPLSSPLASAKMEVGEELQLPFDAIFSPPLNEAIVIPPFEGLLTQFICPAIQRWFATADHNEAAFTVMELAAQSSLLHLVGAVVRQQPELCAVLIERQSIAIVHRFALRSVARLPLPITFLKEYAAYALTYTMETHRTSTGVFENNVVSPRGPLTSQASDGNNSAQRLDTSLDTIHIVQPSTLLPSLAPPAPRLDVGSPPSIGWVPSEALAGMTNGGREIVRMLHNITGAAAGNGAALLSKLRGGPDTPLPSTLCLYVTTKTTEIPACITITPSCATNPNAKIINFPSWVDGISLEASLLLCDRIFPELGEDFSVPTSWGRPKVSFKIFSLYTTGTPDTGRPLLSLSIHKGQLICSIHVPNTQSGQIECRVALKADDWDRFTYISVLVDSGSLMLVKSGEVATAPLTPSLAAALEAILSKQGAVTKLVVGSPVPPGSPPGAEPNTPQIPEDRAMVLISGVRMWGSSVIKSSVKAVAEMVTRDQTLPPFDPSEESCFFLFGEGTGEVVWSVKETFTGRLQGAVRWTPCPFQAGCPLTLDRPDRLHVGTRFALPHNLPRSAVDAYFAALDVVGLDRVARDVLCTMAAHLSRMAVVDALRQALSPSYQVLRYRGRSGKQAQERLVMKDVAHVDSPFAPVLAVVGGAAGGGPIFNPFSILSADGLAKQLTNLFRYDDAGQLRHEDSLLLRRIISQALELWKSQQKDGSAALMTFLSETAMALRDLVRDDAELFHVVVPSSAHSSSGTEGRKGALLPLALINGGTGVLSFDAKSRTVDQATIFKDRGQKNVLAKYPDGQGGWPECTIPAETLWVFARVVTHSNTNTVAKPVAGAATLTLTVRSLRPAVLRSILAPIFLLLSREDPQLEAGLPYFLNAPLVASLLQQGSMSGSSEASLHAISLLTSIFEVWARHSRLQCFDHTPLHVVLVHINVPLVGLMQRGGIPGVSAPEMSVLLTPSLGTYNAYTQSLCNLLLSAIRLECAWRRRSYSSRIRQRWRRLMQLWEQSSFMAPQTARGGENATLTMDALGTNVASPNSREVPATNTDFTRTASPRTTNARSTAGGGGGGGGGGAESAAAKKRDVVPHVKDRAKGHISLIQLSAPSVGPSMNGTTSSGAVLYQRGNGLWHVHCDRHPVTVRSNIGFRKGRFFFEVRVPDNNCTLSVGVVTDRVGMFDAGHALGRDGNSWGFDGARLSRFHQGYRNDFSSRVKWKAGDVIGVLMDLELNRIACLHNDRQVSMFDRFRAGHHGPSASAQGDLPLAYFPAVTVGSCGCDINFGTAPFNSSVPIGYIPVDPTYYCTPEVSRTWCLATAVELAQKITKRQRRSSCTAYSGTTNSMAGDENLGQTPPEEELSHPALVLLHNHVKAYCDGRSGPLSIGLITSSTRAKITNNELRAEDAACVAKGTVAITKGKWYYEVLVHDDAAIGVGWILSDVDWSRSTGLGDEHSWTFECKRMIAKHNKKQLSLGRHQWKNGDVVGCAIDCDEGSMSFTINGSVQRRLHDGSGDGVLFQRVEMGSAGLTPCVALEPKSVCTVVWNKEELQHIPDGFKPLGAGSLVGEGVAKHFLTSDEDRASSPASPNNNASPTAAAATSSAFVPSKSSSIVGGGATLPSITLPMVERLLRHVSANVDLSPLNLSAYCLGGASKDGLKLNAIDGVQVEEFLPLWSVVTSLLDSLFPYGFVGSLPLDTDEANDLSMGPLHFAVSTLRRYAPPHLGLRTLRQFLAATNGAGESLKLTVNRRRALSVMREPSASPSERLRGSLFGQIFRLLALKNAALFTTNKKLWSVTFVGEGADDVGGPYRESLSQLCTELMGTGLSLFLPSPNQANELGESREVFVMNPSLQPPVDLYMFLFLGRLLGGCLRSAEPLPLYLPSTFWKLLVGESPYVQDLERSDAATVKSLDYIRSMGTKHKEGASSIHDVDAELQELCPGGFVMQDDSGVEHELITSGRSIPVDHSNVDLFVTLALAFKLHAMTAAQSFAVKQGFHQVVPLCAVSMLKWYELEELVCGQRDYDPDALLDGARYDRITMDDPRILHLRQVLRGFTRPQRAAFMRFVSGRERLPPGMHLRIMPDDTRREDGGGRDGITPRPPSQQREGTAPSGAARHLHSAQGQSSPSGADYNDDRLPHASTCFFWLSLPRYSSEAALREKLLYAIGQCLDIDADFRVRDNDAVPHEEEPTMARVQIEDEDEFEDFSHLR